MTFIIFILVLGAVVLVHEFGHFIENIFIDEYNKQHLALVLIEC